MSIKKIRASCLIILLSGLLMLNGIAFGQQMGQFTYVWLNGDIYIMNVDGSGERLLASNTFAISPMWSPDGSKIAYDGGPIDNDFEIFVMNADGSNRVQLTHNDISDIGPIWSPDGNKIAFTSYLEDNIEIFVMNADGSNLVNITNHPANDVDPSWSPDGGRIAFASQRESSNYEIYVMNADGSNPIRLTNGLSNNDFPTWSSDGESIAFRRVPNGSYCEEIYKINPDGTNPSSIISGICDFSGMLWLPDSSRILYERSGNLYAAQLDGSGAEPFIIFPRSNVLRAGFDLFLPPTPTPTPTSTPTTAATPTMAITPTPIPCGRGNLPNIGPVDSQLQCLYKMWMIDPAQALAYGTTSLLQFDSNNRVLVDVTLVDAASATTFSQTLPTHGGVAIAQFQAAVAAYIPINALPAAAALPGVMYITGSPPPMTF